MLKAYASYFVSYLLTELKDLRDIESIILFGSVAKDEASKNSDVDIFINVYKKSKKFERRIEKTLSGFYKSREALLFKTENIDNRISVIVGKLDDWKDLKKSIESTGIVLYGKYIPVGKGSGKKQIIFFWNKIEKNRGAFLNKLYGFKVKEKKYKGIVELLGGRKLGKSNIMIPIEDKNEIIKLFKKYEVNAQIIEVYI